MTKPMRRMIIGLSIVFGGLLAFNVIKGLFIRYFFSHYTPPAVTVSAVRAEQRDWNSNLSAVGNFEAINGVEINSEVSGKITGLHFESGKWVQKDELLLDMDDSVDQATLHFNQAELTLQLINSKRQADLFKRGATPSSSLDEANAKRLQAQSNVDKTLAQINEKHLKAPFSGRLGIRQVNLGQYVTPGQTEIVTLQSMDPLYLKFYLPEQTINQLHLNQKITFSVEQSPHMTFQGIITAINSKVDTNTHNIQLQALLANCPLQALDLSKKSPLVTVTHPPLTDSPRVLCNTAHNEQAKVSEFNFVPGMFASIHIEQPPLPNQIVLPSTAISYSLYGNSVFVIESNPDDKTSLQVRRVFVKTGAQEGNYTLIQSGIKAGQSVVSSGELKLQDGTRVVIQNDVPLNETPDLANMGQ